MDAAVALLSQVDGLSVREPGQDSGLPDPQRAIEAFAQRSLSPLSRIPASTGLQAIADWVEDQMQLVGIPWDSLFLIAAGSPTWLTAKFVSRKTWTLFLHALPVLDVLVYSSGSQEILGISEEEHEFLALRIPAAFRRGDTPT